MNIYVISLVRTPLRLETFNSLNGQPLGVQHFPAVDGSILQRPTLIEHGVMESDLSNYTNGALGCALSHKRLWEIAVEKNEPVTILEDDAVMNARFMQMAQSATSQPGEWDTITWGWNFDSTLAIMLPGGMGSCTMKFNQERMRKNLEGFRREIISPAFYQLVSALGTPAYSVSPRGARRLLDWCFPLCNGDVAIAGLEKNVPFNGIDTVMNSFYRETHAQSFVAFPPLVITPNERSISTVQMNVD